MASNATQLGLGALAAAVVGLGVIVLAPSPDDTPTLETAAIVDDAKTQDTLDVIRPAAEPEAQAPAPEVAVVDEPVIDEVAQDTEDPVAAQDIIMDAPAVTRPSFDTFRVEADGNAIVAGRAEPGQIVDIILSGTSLMQVTADSQGSFVALFDIAPSDDARTLRLMADADGANIGSDEMIMVAPFGVVAPLPEVEGIVVADDETLADEPAPEVASTQVTEPEPATDDPVAEAADVIAEQATEILDTSADLLPETTAEAEVEAEAADAVPEDSVADVASSVAIADPLPEPDVETVAEVEAPTTLIADEDGVRVLAAPQVMAAVALDTITYNPAGDVVLAGRAQADGFVRVYIDNQPVTTSRITAGGDWRTDLPDIDTGVYTLRIDEVSDDGAVVSRIETPFKREEAEAVAAVMAEETNQDGFEVAVRTVQPGSTLWAIAQEEMGEGIMYVAVFEANRDLIVDPDLIFPGQVFRIPDVTQ